MASMYGPHEHRFAGMPWFGADGMRVSWGGVFAGVLVALGTVLLMAAIGAALGIAPVGGANGADGAGASIWGEFQRFVALFVGGMVATRTSAIVDRATLVCEGVLVWVVSFAVMAHIGGAGAAALTRGAFSVLDIAPARIAATFASETAIEGQPLANAGANGSPAAGAAKLRAPELAEQVAAVTGLPVADTRAMLAQAAERMEAPRPPPPEVEDTARPRTQALDRALAAQDQTVRSERPRLYAWLALGSLLLSLCAAVSGAMIGRSPGVVVARA